MTGGIEAEPHIGAGGMLDVNDTISFPVKEMPV